MVQDPLAAAESTIAQFASSLGPVGAAVGGTISILGTLAGASFAAAKSLAAIGVEYQNVSLRTGLTTKEVALFGYAAQSTGQDIGIFETAMRKLSAGLSDAGGAGKKTRDALDEIGVKTRDLNGNIRPTSDIFKQISAGLNGITEPARRDALAIELLGRAGIIALPALMKLNDELARGEKLNFAPNDKEIEKFKQYNQELTDLSVLWAKLKRDFEEGLASSIVIKGLVETIQFLDRLISLEEHTKDRGKDSKEGLFSTHTLTAPVENTLALAYSFGMKGSRDDRKSFDEAHMGSNSGGSNISNSPQVQETRGEISKWQPQIDAYNNGTIPGAELQLSAAKEKADKTRVDLESAVKSGSSAEAINKLGGAWKLATADVQKYTDLVKALNTAGEAEKQLANMVKALQSTKEESPLQKLLAEYKSDVSTLKTDKRYTPQAAHQLASGYTYHANAIIDESKRANEGFSLEAQTMGAKDIKEKATELADAFREGLKDAEAGLKTDPVYQMIFNQSDIKQHGPALQRSSQDLLKDSQAQSQHQQRMVEITSLPGNEVSTQQKISDIKVKAAKDEYEDQKNLAARGLVDAQAVFDAKVNYERTLYDIQAENNEKLAELRMAQMNREIDAVSGLFHAALGGGKGITDFFKNIAVSTGDKVLKNALQSNPAGLDKFFPHATEGTVAGSLLKDTLFGPNANKSKIGINATEPTVAFSNATISFDTAVTKFAAAVDSMSAGGARSGFGGGTGLGNGGNIGSDGGWTSYSDGGGSFPMGGDGFSVDGTSGATNPDGVSVNSAMFNTGQGKSGTGISGFTSGLAHTGDLSAAFTGTTWGGDQLTGAQQAGAAIGTAGVVIGGAEAAYSGFKKGGVKGDLQGSAAILGTAAALDPEPISKMVLAGVGMVTGLVTQMLGDPKQLRAEAINKTIGNAKYEAPTAINESMGVNGGYSDMNAFGQVRSSNLSPNPTGVVQPSQWYHGGVYNPIPGSTGTPYGAPMQQPQMNVTNHFTGNVGTQDFFDQSGTMLANTLANQFGVHTGLAVAATKATVGG